MTRIITKKANTEILSLNGFENKFEDSTMSFNDSNRTLTITPSGSSYTVYIDAIEYSITSAKQVIIPDSEGLHIIYFGLSAGEPILISTQTFIDDIILKYAIASIIYWDATNKKSIYFGEERHGINMSRDTHFYIHGATGTQIRTYPILELGLENFSLDGDGSSDAHAQFSVEDGEIFDEDLFFTIEDGVNQDISPILYAPVYYRDGSNGYWRRDNATAFPVKRYGTSRLAYNQYTGSTWQQAEVGNNWFVISLIIGTTGKTEPIKAIQGTQQYSTVGKAKIGAFEEIKTYLLSQSFAVEEVPIGVVIYQTNSTYTNTVKAKIVSIDGEGFIDLRNSDKKDLTSPIQNVFKDMTITGGLSFGESLNPPIITADQLVYSPTGLFEHVLIRIQSSTSVKIRGLPQPDPIEVQVIEFKNYGSSNITFVNDSGLVPAINRFDFDTNKVLGSKGGITVRYDDIDLRWFLTGAVL